MKKLLILLAAVMMFAGGCCGNQCKAEDLINYVPADADGVVVVDAARLVDLRHFKDLRQDDADFNKNWLKFESELQTYGLKIADLPSKVMVFFQAEAGVQKAAVLAITNITEAKLVEMLKANSPKIVYKEQTIAGRKAYVVTQKGETDNEVAATYLQSNLVLICDKDKAEYFYQAVGSKKNEQLVALNKNADSKALIYVLYAKTAAAEPAAAQPASSTAPQAAPQTAGGPLDNMKSAVVALNLSGKNQKDVSLKADLKCIDEQNAVQLVMQLKTFVMIATMQLAKDPALSKAVTEAIVIDQKNRDIKINVFASESLLDQLKNFIKVEKKQAAAQQVALTPKNAPESAVK
ncbi:MAG: hypothetical protein PHH77_06795 [Victivallaceae bacterium]|nr:hypothetical protein [Victivallaceae bacterium]